MPDIFSSWWPWLIGGSTVAIFAALVLVSIVAPSVLPLITAFIKPTTDVLGRIAGDLLENLYDGAKEMKSLKAAFFVATCCTVVAAFVYFPTVHKTTKAVTKKLHSEYRFVPKPKPKTGWF